jgi:hypothetical protein
VLVGVAEEEAVDPHQGGGIMKKLLCHRVIRALQPFTGTLSSFFPSTQVLPLKQICGGCDPHCCALLCVCSILSMYLLYFSRQVYKMRSCYLHLQGKDTLKETQ